MQQLTRLSAKERLMTYATAMRHQTDLTGTDISYFSGIRTNMVAANFSAKPARMKIQIPHHAFEWMGIPVTDVLNPDTYIEVEVPPMDGRTIELI